ncbi:MAG TPA: aminotransferase class V-fold PLP-dependent enzyme, partial [Syntrophomonadaceae bacterium]|nr:aminotransferase class V-fold PLP-dependent enzyme [Syntrophomonadaceae bacterium]
FTSGGTEADNQAIISYMLSNPQRGRHLITSAIEHHAVIHTFQFLEKYGFETTVLPVNSYGQVEAETLKKVIRPDTSLVSIMHANNEIGTIQSIEELAAICHESQVAFHTDAVQTIGKIPVDVKQLNVDMLSASSHKLYGPKGIGCLYVKKGTRLSNLLHGGGQENKMRAGTENVPGMVGFGKAAELAQKHMKEQGDRLTSLGRRLVEGLVQAVPDTLITGHPELRVPGSVSVCFRFVEGESIILMLDSYGISASSGSACTSGSLDPSHVLLAIGLPHEIAHGSLRLTLGKGNSDEDVDFVLQVVPGIISNLRRMSPLYSKGGSN